jgi:GNAT superfamily N-acetyltransferase
MSIDEYVVELAAREHIPMLPDIERAAAALFPADILPPGLRAGAVPVEQLERARLEGRLWTAATTTGRPVGFAIAAAESNTTFLQEMDVHPDHQNKGLGRRLVQSVITWARTHGHSCITLTTFERIPWNAPYYARLGFRIMAEDELTTSLREHLDAERAQGLQHRVAMQKVLAAWR